MSRELQLATNTDGLLDQTSLNPTSHKATAIRTLTRREQIVCDSQYQIVETSVANNIPSQDSKYPDDNFQSKYFTPGFKPFSILSIIDAICIYSLYGFT